MKKILFVFVNYKVVKKKCKCNKCKCKNIKSTKDIDTSIAVAKFHEDCSNPIRGKNVLIIGASKGIGHGAAVAFSNAGANVRNFVAYNLTNAESILRYLELLVPPLITQDNLG